MPVVWEAGLNAGVLFMRLDRMREFKFQEKLLQSAKKYKSKLIFTEQDLINIVFSTNIGIILVLFDNRNKLNDDIKVVIKISR